MKIFFGAAHQSAADLISLFAQGYRPPKRPQGLPGLPGWLTQGDFSLGQRAVFPVQGRTGEKQHFTFILLFVPLLSNDRRERAVKSYFRTIQ